MARRPKYTYPVRDLVCECGAPFRARHGRQCRRCRYDAERQPCPDCGNPMAPRANRCQPCRAALRGEDHPSWKGGTHLDGGYIMQQATDHPRANRGGYVYQHILVMEAKLGRYLRPGENVHHKNGIRTDNSPGNLELWARAQPAGQRVEDLVAWARELIERYGEEFPS